MPYSITTREVAEQPVIVGRRQAPRSEVATAIGEVLPRVFRYVQENGFTLTGRPFVRYVDPGPDAVTFEPGMPIESRFEEVAAGGTRDGGGLELDALPGGTVATTIHVGPYQTLHAAYAALEKWIADEGLTTAGAPWESYLTDPTAVPDPANWKTEVCWPVS